MSNFDEKFERDDTHHSFCLRADGCFKRHDLPRDKQHMSREENLRTELNTFNTTESKERRLINKVAYLQKIGCQLSTDETLEEYVARNTDKFNQDT